MSYRQGQSQHQIRKQKPDLIRHIQIHVCIFVDTASYNKTMQVTVALFPALHAKETQLHTKHAQQHAINNYR